MYLKTLRVNKSYEHRTLTYTCIILFCFTINNYYVIINTNVEIIYTRIYLRIIRHERRCGLKNKIRTDGNTFKQTHKFTENNELPILVLLESLWPGGVTDML